MTNTGIGGHQSPHKGAPNTWLTPLELIDALGPYDLDPCAAPSPRPWATATRHLELPENGLAAEWLGRVWLNPPYGPHAAKWLRRLAEHGQGTALVFARTETAAWHAWIWTRATAILFLEGRFTFRLPDGAKPKANGGAPSALIAYGPYDAERLRTAGLKGFFVDLAAVCANPG